MLVLLPVEGTVREIEIWVRPAKFRDGLWRCCRASAWRGDARRGREDQGKERCVHRKAPTPFCADAQFDRVDSADIGPPQHASSSLLGGRQTRGRPLRSFAASAQFRRSLFGLGTDEETVGFWPPCAIRLCAHPRRWGRGSFLPKPDIHQQHRSAASPKAIQADS
jgi:hypothetical protein